MAKIRITEDELKQIIRESIENELDEAWFDGRNKFAKWGYQWDDAKTGKENRTAARDLVQNMKNAGFSKGEAGVNSYNELNSLRDQVSKLTASNGSLQKQLNQSQSQVNSLTAERDKLSNQNQQLRTQLQQEIELNRANQKPLLAQATTTGNQNQLAPRRNQPQIPAVGGRLKPNTAQA